MTYDETLVSQEHSSQNRGKGSLQYWAKIVAWKSFNTASTNLPLIKEKCLMTVEEPGDIITTGHPVSLGWKIIAKYLNVFPFWSLE